VRLEYCQDGAWCWVIRSEKVNLGCAPCVSIRHMKRGLCTALVSIGALTITACAPYVRSDVNTALIGQVRCGSFAWAGEFRSNSPLRSTIANPLNESRLRSAIASHLGNRVQPGPGNADCLVGYGIGGYYAVSGAYPYPYPYGWAWNYPYGWGPGPYAYTYPEGVIAVDLYDARTGQPLWHASTEQSLFGVSGPEAEKRIDSAVAAIFTKYPYTG
jgi:hypothetical protein